ncbi:hypothetical protein RB195_020309 [Necator americanus]|uniref:Carboxypeptidase n=1 Tax=Necator americanus TaxID=51031 RepID=A0ABR1CKI7_NECAM
MASAVAVALLLVISQCILAEEINDLPGAPKLNFKQHSGYYTVGGEAKNHKMHYWFVESQSDPKSDPVILWLTGGPGCSGLSALLTEWGPFMVNPDGATLRENPYSWNKKASVLTIEAPAGVGYSYSTDGNTKTNDDQTASENWEVLVAFFEEYSHLKENDFYVTGESYAGIYVPTLVQTILDRQEKSKINIKGFAIGNGCVSESTGIDTLINFEYGHGMIDDSQWQQVKEQCCENDVDGCAFHEFQQGSKCYRFALEAFRMAWAGGLNPYNMYADCAQGEKREVSTRFRVEYEHFMGEKLNVTELLPVPCMNETAVTTYLNRPDVRKALGIPDDLKEWSLCSDVGYRKQHGEMAERVKNALDAGLKGMLFSGDVDMACNFLMGERFSRQLGFKETQQKKTYHVDGQVGGFYTQYENLHWVTVRGAGHMVPTDKPSVSLHILNAFMENKGF